MRSEFEKLPEIATHLHNVVFDVGHGEYLPKQMGYIAHEFSAYFLNGAYYAYQEQQKKLDAIKKICDSYWLDDDKDYNIYIQDIEELLK